MHQKTGADKLTTGAFAKVARLSVKALRLYDALGLLTPSVRDPDSRYRYYAAAQLERARLIGLLRQLDMPLTRIAQVIDLPGPAAADGIGAYWREVERDAEVKSELVQYLGRYLRGEGKTMYEVKEREVGRQKVATIQRNVFVKELPDFIGEAMNELHGALKAAGLDVAGPAFVIYHGQVNDDSDGPVEVCLPLEGSLEPQGDVRVRLEGEHREAYTTITREQLAFPGILEAYDAVHAYAEARTLQETAPPREVYFADVDKASQNDPVCDVAWPVK